MSLNLLLGVAAVVGIFLWWRRMRAISADTTDSTEYHAVACVGNCPALKPYLGRRYLAREAPPLPVPECGNPHCQCRYVHYEDRRGDIIDRRSYRGLATQLYMQQGGAERRRPEHGRRERDLAEA